MKLILKKVLWGTALTSALALAAAVVAILAGARPGEQHQAAAAEESGSGAQDADDGVLSVKTIRPKHNPAFVISVKELADVEGFFQTELRSRVAGTVKFIQKDYGDRVTHGEVLIEIDVPDQIEEIAQREAEVQQRRQEVELAKRRVDVARALAEVAHDTIDEKEADIAWAEATRVFRQRRLERFRGLAKSTAVTEGIVDEEERDYEAAKAKAESARAAVKVARANAKEADASQAAAAADVNLKEALVEVARRSRDRARALASYAKITADYDGVVIERRVDPGTFVQSAATAHTEPLLTVARTDIVTVTMKVPDNFAPYVSKNTDAVIQMGDLLIQGKVTRYAPYIQSKDRTMHVEVDLFNGTEQEYEQFARKALSTLLTPVGTGRFAEALTLMAAGRSAWGPNVKGFEDPFPLFPKVRGKYLRERPHRLLPGMTGTMRLRLRSQDAYLLPTSAVFSRGGKTYILRARDGKAQLVPVEVQAEDGKQVKVGVLIRPAHARPGDPEVVRELTGEEEVIVSGQGEISDGQAVKTTLVSW
jgi:multidrug efflux pump subunit AcrA (membrane-fusion protein)